MTFATVEDLFAEAPGFRERAKAAYAEEQAAKARAYRAEAEALLEETLAVLADDFKIGEPELAGTDFEEKPYNPSTPSFLFEIDGIKLRARYARYAQKRVMTKKSSEFDEEHIYDKYIAIEVFAEGVWKTASNLTMLGSLV